MKIIIVGAGEVGYHIASRLAFENKDVVVIDKSVDAIRRVTENLDVQGITASGSSPEILEKAGIRQAEILLAVTDSDEANLVACLMADMLSPATRTLARIRNAHYDQYHGAFKTAPPPHKHGDQSGNRSGENHLSPYENSGGSGHGRTGGGKGEICGIAPG